LSHPSVHLDLREGNYWATLARPHVLNAFDETLLRDLADVLNEIRDSARPLIFTGAGRAFSAGGDLKAYLAKVEDRDALESYFLLLAEVLTNIIDYAGVTIAAVNGVAAAGGLELMCVCDLAVATESARFADAHINYGLHPGAGASGLLSHMIGERRARWLLLSGEFIDAVEAERIGLVNRVVADGELEPAANAMAHAISRHSIPAVKRIKKLIRPEIEQVLRAERESLLAHFRDPETRSRLAGFADRSKNRQG